MSEQIFLIDLMQVLYIASQYNEIISQCPKPHPILPLKFFLREIFDK